jgi:hypothetical protein
MTFPLATPCRSPSISSCCVNSSPPRYFSIRLSSTSLLAAEILLDQAVVHLGHGLDELLAIRFRVCLERLGYVTFGGFRALEGLHCQQIDDAFKAVVSADGHLHRHAVPAEPGLDVANGPGEVRVLPVHLVDKDEAWQIGLLAVAPYLLRAYLHSGGRLDKYQGGLADPNPGQDLTDEVGIPRRVYQVHLGVTPLVGQEAQADADVSLVLGRVVV